MECSSIYTKHKRAVCGTCWRVALFHLCDTLLMRDLNLKYSLNLPLFIRWLFCMKILTNLKYVTVSFIIGLYQNNPVLF